MCKSKLQYAKTSLFRSGILVTSDHDIVVQGINARDNSLGAFQVPPVSHQLGYVHVAMTYKHTVTSKNPGPYEIAIVATHSDPTTVEILLHSPVQLSVNFSGATYTNGDSIIITLQQYEAAQVIN